jgi:hypothetical protein
MSKQLVSTRSKVLQKRLAAQSPTLSGTCVSLVNLGFAQIYGLNGH